MIAEYIRPRQLWNSVELFSQLFQRDLKNRYRGAILGFGATVANQLLMLALYLMVFGFVFNSRYGLVANETGVDYAFGLFIGLSLFNYTAECLARAPGLISENPNYVKKVVFPLELIPVSINCAVLAQFALSALPILLIFSLITGHLSWEAFWIFPILFALFFLNLGLLWLISAIGVFIRDVQLLIGPVNQVLLFGSAVFYSVARLPQPFRSLIAWNPFAQLFQMARAAMLGGQQPNLLVLGAIAGFGILLSWLCLLCFRSLKPAFADVL